MLLKELGINSGKEKQLNKKGIYTIEDLINFFPRRYNDLSKETGLLDDDKISCTVMRVEDVKQYNNGKIPLIIATGNEITTGKRIKAMWFRKNFMFRSLYNAIGEDVYICGKATYSLEYKNYTISEPLVFTTRIKEAKKIYPVYSKIQGMSEEYLEKHIKDALSFRELLKDILPEEIIEEEYLKPLEWAIKEIHNPTSMGDLKKAQDRIIYNDLLYFALCMEFNSRKVSKGSSYNIKNLKITKNIIKSLPFQLTSDQENAVNSMIELARNGQRINGLVQGDVGAGKTIVAFLLMTAMVDSGYQAALMAPTQVLAKQHYDELRGMLEPYGIKVGFLGGSQMRKSERSSILKELESGEIKIMVGTHSLLNKDVKFKNLAITITDEEHKFGVIQREMLVEKAAQGVHSITMSATPIPRSLAQILYNGEIQLYTIKTMPNGRKPVKTVISNSISGTHKSLLSQLEQGRQAYVVCPMIDKNEDMEGVQSVEEVFEIYKKTFEPLGYSVVALTGRNTKDEVEEIIKNFKERKTQILVSTTVIEVGVNVPNASVIVIHNAERFGLSGLHQLRGRVGRGKYQSYCVLLSEKKDNERLNVMTSTTDGFKIAEEDLKLRGAGDLIGTKQSGDDKYINLMLMYSDLYQTIQKVAIDMIDEDMDCKLMEQIKAKMELET
jgi:ATP-dependent DNA helicase RecG